MIFLRPYTLKRAVVKTERAKEGDPEAGGAAQDSEKVAPADQGTPAVDGAEARRSTSKSRDNAPDDVDAGTIAGEPEIAKEKE